MAINCFMLFIQQAGVVSEATVQIAKEENFLSILMKGGWILAPLFFLSLVAIYVICDRWVKISRAGKRTGNWIPQVAGFIQDGKFDKVINFCEKNNTPSAKVIAAGLRVIDDKPEDIQESMQVEARQQIAFLENQMNYLGIISSIAPMLGFLGTIFGVIKIFYNIALTNNLEIATISDGLYQKMICSGVGLAVGIIAYSGYYLLNGGIDKIVNRTDRDANEILRAIKVYKSRRGTL